MFDDEPKSLEESLVATLARTDLRDTITELSEVGLDALFDDGVARDVPIIGTLFSLASGVMTIRDRLFAKKVLRFLAALDDIPREERQAQIDHMAADPKERRRIGEQLILLLDRLNDMGKPALLAKAFQAFLKDQIERAQFQALANAIDGILPENVGIFKSRMDARGRIHDRESDDATANFMQCGLVVLKLEDIDTTARWGDGSVTLARPGYYATSRLGSLFYEIVLKN
ncbi:MAG: hypothetical protein SGI88_16520 [Candidatus Hydrogenedentes bacterium]|nr:hypothetical protein [Candidatus Hydrogenedentota bacterium]